MVLICVPRGAVACFEVAGHWWEEYSYWSWGWLGGCEHWGAWSQDPIGGRHYMGKVGSRYLWATKGSQESFVESEVVQELVLLSQTDTQSRQYLNWLQSRFGASYTGGKTESQGLDFAGYLMRIRYQETFGEYGFKRNFRWAGVDGSYNGLTISVRDYLDLFLIGFALGLGQDIYDNYNGLPFSVRDHLDSFLIGFALGFGQDIYILVWMVRMMHFWIHLCFSLAISKDAISVRIHLGSSYIGFALGSGIMSSIHGYAVWRLPHRKGVWKYGTATWLFGSAMWRFMVALRLEVARCSFELELSWFAWFRWDFEFL